MTKSISRIEVGTKKLFPDIAGLSLRQTIAEDLGMRNISVRVIDAFTLNFPLSARDLDRIASRCFADRILQEYSIAGRDGPLASHTPFDFIVEVGFRPGVTDNVGMTAKEALEDALGITLSYDKKVFTSKQYLFSGRLTKEDVGRIIMRLVANELIERRSEVLSGHEFRRHGLALPPPVVEILDDPVVERILLPEDDNALMELSSSRLLALDLNEMQAIREYFRQEGVIRDRQEHGLTSSPTDVEIEALAQTWSEHCKHKIFNAKIHIVDHATPSSPASQVRVIDSLFRTYIVRATQEIRKKKGRKDPCVTVFTDNAGVIRFDDRHNLVFKVETHNAPSALDPYGGALTGIVGVNRDPMGTGLGARLIFNTDIFCFGSPALPESHVPKGVLHPLTILKGVRKGVEHGGNKIGIPTVNGTVYFDECYTVRPLVFCGTGGIMPKAVVGRPSHKKTVKHGDFIVMIGGRIGKDGIHGATFSSAKLDESSPMSAVQIGAPIVQKNMMDALEDARNQGLYTAITDNGAGGLSSSVGEMARLCGGFALHLDKAPLKYAGLKPWEILLSEAQERMTLAVPHGKSRRLLAFFKRRGVEATVLGKFTREKKFHALYKGKTVAFMDMDFVHEGLPQMELEAVISGPLETPSSPHWIKKQDLTPALHTILSDLHVASKEWAVRQYDHEVQGNTVIKPLVGALNDGPSNAAVIKPLTGSWRGVAVANDITPRYGRYSSYHMTACSIDACIRKLMAVGASLNGIVLLDNFCWPSPLYDTQSNPDGREKLGRLVESARALYDFTTLYGTPLISGKDSMANDRVISGKKYSIIPTILISGMGVVKDVRRCVTMDAKAPGDLVYVLGETGDEMGGSVYEEKFGMDGSHPPHVDGKENLKLYRGLERAIAAGCVSSCHAVTDGGLGTALTETAFSGMLGMKVDLRRVPTRDTEIDDALLFSESAGRFVATIEPSKKKMFESCLKGAQKALIGEVLSLQEGMTVIGLKGRAVIRSKIEALKDSWQRPLKW